jgi:hypothetical protein
MVYVRKQLDQYQHRNFTNMAFSRCFKKHLGREIRYCKILRKT